MPVKVRITVEPEGAEHPVAIRTLDIGRVANGDPKINPLEERHMYEVELGNGHATVARTRFAHTYGDPLEVLVAEAISALDQSFVLTGGRKLRRPVVIA